MFLLPASNQVASHKIVKKCTNNINMEMVIGGLLAQQKLQALHFHLFL